MGKSRTSNPTSRGRKLREIAKNEANEDLGRQGGLPVSVARAMAKRTTSKPVQAAASKAPKPFARDLLEIRPDETADLDPYIGNDADLKDPSASESKPLADPRSDRRIKARRSVASKN